MEQTFYCITTALGRLDLFGFASEAERQAAIAQHSDLVPVSFELAEAVAKFKNYTLQGKA